MALTQKLVMIMLMAFLISTLALHASAGRNSPFAGTSAGSVAERANMEMDDLSLEEQEQVMGMSQRLDAATRQLLTEDPYSV